MSNDLGKSSRNEFSWTPLPPRCFAGRALPVQDSVLRLGEKAYLTNEMGESIGSRTGQKHGHPCPGFLKPPSVAVSPWASTIS